MSSPIPFDRDLAFEYGRVDVLSPRVRRVIANNPGPFTHVGTGVYIVGDGEVAVIDPGPDQPDHRAALWRALEGERVTHVLVTHHHRDHSPLAHPLAEAHGCTVYGGRGAHISAAGRARVEEGDDAGFRPDVVIEDGATFTGPGWSIETLHTPGHTSNHMCFALLEENLLFSGDHVMAWSTSVVSPPDGDMGDYLRSLARVRDRGFATLWPTHGPAVRQPRAFIDALIRHRRGREAQILDQLDQGRACTRDMVPHLYPGLDPRLHAAAAQSVLAHLIHLIERGLVISDRPASLDAAYARKSSASSADG